MKERVFLWGLSFYVFLFRVHNFCQIFVFMGLTKLFFFDTLLSYKKKVAGRLCCHVGSL